MNNIEHTDNGSAKRRSRVLSELEMLFCYSSIKMKYIGLVKSESHVTTLSLSLSLSLPRGLLGNDCVKHRHIYVYGVKDRGISSSF